MNRFIVWLSVSLLPGFVAANDVSTYVGQETRAIKALSPTEQSDWIAGKGLGLAKAAELNGYPGPRHVLDLGDALGLSEVQRERTQALFESMQGRAQALGRALVAQEQALDALFAARSVTAESLEEALSRIATLQARVRGVHLEAHLQQVALLSEQQVAKYNQLRGYDAGSVHNGHVH